MAMGKANLEQLLLLPSLDAALGSSDSVPQYRCPKRLVAAFLVIG